MRSSLKLGLALAVLTVGVASQAEAQATPEQGSLNATVNVMAALKVSGKDLTFGNLAAGHSKTIAANDMTNAGLFTIEGAPGAFVAFSFAVLPGNLGHTTVTIDSWTGRHGSTTSTADGTFTPSTTYSGSYQLNGTGQYYVAIGATVHTTTASPATAHSGTITANVVYN